MPEELGLFFPMNPNLHIQFRDIAPSPALTERVRKEFQKLSGHHENIVSCRATIGMPHSHHQHGKHFQVHLEIAIPRNKVIVDHNPPARQAVLRDDKPRAVKGDEIDVTHKDAYVAIRDVFEAAQRRLDELVRRRRDSRRMARTSALSLRNVAY